MSLSTSLLAMWLSNYLYFKKAFAYLSQTSNKAILGRGKIIETVAVSRDPEWHNEEGSQKEIQRDTQRGSGQKTKKKQVSRLYLDFYAQMEICCHVYLYRPGRWMDFITNDLCIYDMLLYLYLLLGLTASCSFWPCCTE